MERVTKDERKIDSVSLRLSFVDDQNLNPVPGLVVSVFGDSYGDARASEKQNLPLATLQTDAAGYVSFKFDHSISATSSGLTVTYGSVRNDTRDFNIADLLAGNDAHTIRVDVSDVATERNSGLPAVMSPADIRDLTLSPASIGLIPQLSRGRGLCEQLMPTTLTVRRFRAFQVVADICTPEALACPDRIQIVKGRMLEYEVAWHPVGTSLGDLLNTITLAPCEQVNIAIADWMRRETASRAEATDIQQQSFQETDHERLLVETMRSLIKTKSFAAAAAGGTKAGASIPIKGIKLDLSAAFSGGVGFSSSSQSIAANTTSRLSDHITQAASFVASQRTSVVFQATASEQQTYQTRRIGNSNPCRTLTIVYYAVNRSYRVVTDYKGEREVVLVKYENNDFDAKRAYCNAHLLKDELIDPSLSTCFDTLGDALFCCDQEPPPRELLMDSLTMTFKLEGGQVPLRMSLVLFAANGPMTLPPINLLGAVQLGGTFTHTFNLPGQVDPKQVTSIVAFFQYPLGPFGGPKVVHLTDVKVTYHAVGHDDPLALFSSPAVTAVSSLEMLANAELPPETEASNECIETSCCVKKLIAHLNCHKLYYNSLVWLNEEPNERVVRWSCCSKDGSPFSLIGQIENTPVTVYGDFVVFPAAGSTLVDDPTILPVSKLETMPTPGVYAEGILGQCNSCEKVDPERPWNWEKPPCGCNKAADLTDPLDPQTGVKPDDLKADEIKNQITFTNVPSAPNNIFGELIKSLISSADSGSSQAKALLEKMLDLIKASLTPATPPKDEKK